MNIKLLSPIILIFIASFFTTGCKTYDNGTVESGQRTTFLLGLIDYQKDYSLDGEFEGFLLDEKPLESDTYTALRGITSYAADHNYELEGEKLSLFWGLIKLKY